MGKIPNGFAVCREPPMLAVTRPAAKNGNAVLSFFLCAETRV